MFNYLPTKDLKLQQWLANFITVASAAKHSLG